MTKDPSTQRAGWTRLSAAQVPRPTYFPAGVALGIAFTFWSLITSWVVLAVGLCLLAACLAGWIREIRHERKQH